MFVCVYYLLTRDWLPQDLALLSSSWLSSLPPPQNMVQRPGCVCMRPSVMTRHSQAGSVITILLPWHYWYTDDNGPIIPLPPHSQGLKVLIKSCQQFLMFCCLQNFYFSIKGSFQSMQKTFKTIIFHISFSIVKVSWGTKLPIQKLYISLLPTDWSYCCNKVMRQVLYCIVLFMVLSLYPLPPHRLHHHPCGITQHQLEQLWTE